MERARGARAPLWPSTGSRRQLPAGGGLRGAGLRGAPAGQACGERAPPPLDTPRYVRCHPSLPPSLPPLSAWRACAGAAPAPTRPAVPGGPRAAGAPPARARTPAPSAHPGRRAHTYVSAPRGQVGAAPAARAGGEEEGGGRRAAGGGDTRSRSRSRPRALRSGLRAPRSRTRSRARGRGRQAAGGRRAGSYPEAPRVWPGSRGFWNAGCGPLTQQKRNESARAILTNKRVHCRLRRNLPVLIYIRLRSPVQPLKEVFSPRTSALNNFQEQQRLFKNSFKARVSVRTCLTGGCR